MKTKKKTKKYRLAIGTFSEQGETITFSCDVPTKAQTEKEIAAALLENTGMRANDLCSMLVITTKSPITVDDIDLRKVYDE